MPARPATPAAEAKESSQRLCEASEAKEHDKTLALGEALLVTHPDHPDFATIDEVRFKLAECLAGMRSLVECIALCRENLDSAPDSPGADYWRFLIPQSQFRLWRSREAEEGLKTYLASYHESEYAGHAVADPVGSRTTVMHEMTHAGFKNLMGRSYDDMPDWIAEGLAPSRSGTRRLPRGTKARAP